MEIFVRLHDSIIAYQKHAENSWLPTFMLDEYSPSLHTHIHVRAHTHTHVNTLVRTSGHARTHTHTLRESKASEWTRWYQRHMASTRMLFALQTSTHTHTHTHTQIHRYTHTLYALTRTPHIHKVIDTHTHMDLNVNTHLNVYAHTHKHAHAHHMHTYTHTRTCTNRRSLSKVSTFLLSLFAWFHTCIFIAKTCWEVFQIWFSRRGCRLGLLFIALGDQGDWFAFICARVPLHIFIKALHAYVGVYAKKDACTFSPTHALTCKPSGWSAIMSPFAFCVLIHILYFHFLEHVFLHIYHRCLLCLTDHASIFTMC